MAYKEKTCEHCGSKHTKRNRFCSKKCADEANRGRKWTKQQKEAVSSGLKEWHATSDTAAVSAYNFTSKGANKPSEPPLVPSRLPLDNNQFVADGDLWTNCD